SGRPFEFPFGAVLLPGLRKGRGIFGRVLVGALCRSDPLRLLASHRRRSQHDGQARSGLQTWVVPVSWSLHRLQCVTLGLIDRLLRILRRLVLGPIARHTRSQACFACLCNTGTIKSHESVTLPGLKTWAITRSAAS